MGHNIDSDGSCDLTAPGDLPSADPVLGPLQEYDGPTWTMLQDRGARLSMLGMILPARRWISEVWSGPSCKPAISVPSNTMDAGCFCYRLS